MSHHTPRPHSPLVSPPKVVRRIKPWMIVVGISVGWKIVVLTLGAAVPRWVIGDGLDLVPAESREYALQAKVTAMALWDHPLERLGIVRALRVIRVDNTTPRSLEHTAVPTDRRLPDNDATYRAAAVSDALDDADSAGASCQGRSATVRAYTYFAIPYSQARMTCESGVIEYRVFRRRP